MKLMNWNIVDTYIDKCREIALQKFNFLKNSETVKNGLETLYVKESNDFIKKRRQLSKGVEPCHIKDRALYVISFYLKKNVNMFQWSCT